MTIGNDVGVNTTYRWRVDTNPDSLYSIAEIVHTLLIRRCKFQLRGRENSGFAPSAEIILFQRGLDGGAAHENSCDGREAKADIATFIFSTGSYLHLKRT